MRYCDLEAGDVVFPATNDLPWIVLNVDGHSLSYFNEETGETSTMSNEGEGRFGSGVRVYRGSSLLLDKEVRSLT